MRKGAFTRLEILETALPLASRVGLSGLSIGALAGALGMSKSGLFAHFRSKEALELAVVEHAEARFVERVVRPTLKAARGVPRVRALLAHWLGWLESEVAETGCFYAAAAFEYNERPGPVRDRVLAQQRDFVKFLTTVTRTAVTEGHFRPALDVDQFAYELFGILLASQRYAGFLRDPKARDRAELAFDGLVRAAKSPGP